MLRLYGGTGLTPQELLSWALAKEFQIQEMPEIGRTESNKPYFPALPRLHVNWSHSGPFVLCALGDRPVGVDIEVIRPRSAALPRYALTALEYAQYQAGGADWPAFYTLWTRKEAWCKYTGQGLRPLWGQDIPTDGLFLRSYQGTTWRAALCGEEEAPAAIQWKKETL